MSTNREAVYVIDGLRSPILKARGQPGPFTAAEMATQTASKLLMRHTEISTHIDEVVIGCVMPRPDEVNIARILSLRLGLPHSVPAMTVQRNCASGMQALHSAMQRIHLHEADLILAGGVEVMSHAPLLFNSQMIHWLADMQKARSVTQRLKQLIRWRPSMLKPVIGLQCGLTDPTVNLSMGQTAEIISQRFEITRTQMDTFALQSHQRLAHAQEQSILADEITSLFSNKGDMYALDDGVRIDSSLEKLSTLSPVFDRRYGQITAGNSAQISDGAACLLLASEKAVREHGLKPLARLVDCAWAGLDPAQMGLGPVYATHQLLSRLKMTLSDIEYWEINEAFAAQVLACLKAFASDKFCRNELHMPSAWGNIDPSSINIHGGAVACGHPVGMTGARIVLHLIHVLKQHNAHRGVATLCIGGGQGGAMLVEV